MHFSPASYFYPTKHDFYIFLEGRRPFLQISLTYKMLKQPIPPTSHVNIEIFYCKLLTFFWCFCIFTYFP